AGEYIQRQRKLDREPKPWRAGTCNHAIKALRAFANFLIGCDPPRLRRNPFDSLKLYRVDTDRAFTRGELTIEEIGKVVSAADSDRARYGMPGIDRGMLYRVRLATALRAQNLRTLTPASFDLAGETPTIAAKAKGKLRQDKEWIISPELAAILRPWVATKPAGKPVFESLPDDCNIVRMWRRDLKSAGVPEFDSKGGKRDFYA